MAKNKTCELLTYDQFQEHILDQLRAKMGVGYEIDLNFVLRNNSVTLVGVVIKQEEDLLSPTIYLESYYQLYLKKVGMEELVDNIMATYRESLKKGLKEVQEIQYNWDCVKDHIYYRVVNRDKNKKLLEKVPHLLYLDLAITFQYLVSNQEESIGSIRVTKEHMKGWGIKLKDIRDAAIINTPRLFPPIIRNLYDVFMEILSCEDSHGQDYGICDPVNYIPSDFFKETMIDNEKEEDSMYVLTNTKGINGASCILYKEVLKDFATKLNSDIFLLPSSIHEVIIVKDNGCISVNDLIEVVMDVNKNVVEEEDLLSNKIYYYSREKNMLTLL